MPEVGLDARELGVWHRARGGCCQCTAAAHSLAALVVPDSARPPWLCPAAGIEAVDDLIADLDQAFRKAAAAVAARAKATPSAAAAAAAASAQ